MFYKTRLLYSGIFAIAMAYLESAVVVYLRLHYYPDGFSLPLVEIPPAILWTEIGREAATIIMLLSVSRILAQNGREWFAYFSINFGVWDIWYYIWLKILLDWPASIMEWDILFLIPVIWIGPVLAPVLVSSGLIVAGIIILKYHSLRLSRIEWLLECLSGIIIIFSFLTPDSKITLTSFPDSYPWIIFMSGMGLGLAVFFNRLRLTLKKNS